MHQTSYAPAYHLEGKKMGTTQTKEEFEAKRAALTAALKKAQKDLWDHVHPVIEDPQLVADQKFWEAKKSERKAAKK
jgi:hypothetical protein